MAVKPYGKSKGLACPSKKNKPGEFTSSSMENFYYKVINTIGNWSMKRKPSQENRIENLEGNTHRELPNLW